jgi:hypothetical protein
MTFISDFKGSAISFWKQGTSNNTGTGDVVTSIQNAQLGQRFSTGDGREVALVSVGATALASGVLLQAPVITAGHQTLAMTVPATAPATSGTFLVSVTNGATVINEGYYNGGFLIVKDGTGAGQTLKIKSHSGAATSAQCVITLEDAIVTTLDATSVVNLIANPYSNVIISPTTPSAQNVGVTAYLLAASVAPTYNVTTGAIVTAGTAQYGFIVSKGLTSCLSDASTATAGLSIARSTTTAGSVTVGTATGYDIGTAVQTSISGKYGAIFVDL